MRIFVAILGRMRLCLPHKYENNVFVGIHGEREREKAQAFTTKRFVIINVTKHEVHNKYHGISGEKF